MTIEVSLLLSGISIAFAIYFGICTKSRNAKKDTQEEAGRDAAVMTKLENIQQSVTEMKVEMKGYRQEVDAVKAQNIRNEESLKSLHKRMDRMEKAVFPAPHAHEE